MTGAYALPRFSPDGRKLAYLENAGLSVHDLERDTTSRLSLSGGRATQPVWAPDSKHLVVGTEMGTLSWIRSDGAGEPQKLLDARNRVVRPYSISLDGKWLAYYEIDAEAGYDVSTLPLDLRDPDHPIPGKPEVFLRTPAAEGLRVPRFSPDGRWIAYRSYESGTPEIYVRPFPAGTGGKSQISSGGGLYAYWSSNGRELFFQTADYRIMVLDYTVDGVSFVPGKARMWSNRQLFYTGTSNLDLAPDGKRFAVFTLPEAPPGAKGSVHVTMLLNFLDELKRKIP